LKRMEESIKILEQKSLKVFQRTQDKHTSSRHKAHVCIICDCFILGNDSICYLHGKDIKNHKHRIGVVSYQKHYNTVLKSELVKQYQFSSLPGLLLSPRSRQTDKGYVKCSSCSETMQQVNIKLKGPPRFAIANGFVVEYFPEVFLYTDEHGKQARTKIDIERYVNDVLRALLAPIRPCGFVTTFYGGSHQSVHGQ
jgi:hypothetical protein